MNATSLELAVYCVVMHIYHFFQISGIQQDKRDSAVCTHHIIIKHILVY